MVDVSPIAVSTATIVPQKIELEAPSAAGAFRNPLRELLWRCAKPLMAVALGAQLFLGSVSAKAADASLLGAWSPARTEYVQKDSTGPAKKLLEDAAPKLEKLRVAVRAQGSHAQDLALAKTRLEACELNQGGHLDGLEEVKQQLAALDAKISAERDPIELRLLNDDRALLLDRKKELLAWGTQLASDLVAQQREVGRLEAAMPRFDRAVKSAESALKSELQRATQLLQKLGVSELPWMIHDVSLSSLGLTPPNTEAERILNFAARVEAYVARNGTLPAGEERTTLAITPNQGLDWALAKTPRDIVLPAEMMSTVKPFDYVPALVPVRTLAVRLSRDTAKIDLRDLQMFAHIPSEEHAAFIDELVALDTRAGGLKGSLHTFAAFRGAHLDAAADLAKRSGLGLSAESLPFFAMGAAGHAHQRAQVAWLLENARFQGRGGEMVLAENWAAYSGRELASFEALATRLGHKLSIAEIEAATRYTRTGELSELAQNLGPGIHAFKDLYFLANRPSLSSDRSTLLAEVQSRLRPGVDRLDRDYTEDLASAKLSTIDLQKIVVLQRGLESKELRTELAAMMRADSKDGTTELGGRLLLSGEEVVVAAENGSGQGNNTFVLGPKLNPVESFLSFHFHAVDAHGERENAGPSPGKSADMGTAYTIQLDGVVITMIAKDRMNIDFYTADGAVLDLGIFHAP